MMDEIAENKSADRFHTMPESVNSDDRTNLLNQANTFALFDRWGNVLPSGKMVQGIYHHGTRFVNSLIVAVNNRKPLLLSSNVTEDNHMLSVDLANPEEGQMDSNSVHIYRKQVISEGRFREELTCQNFGHRTYSFELSITCDSDFKDIFEIRGSSRKVTPHPVAYQSAAAQRTMTYAGLDGLHRSTVMTVETDIPFAIRDKVVIFKITLRPGEKCRLQYRLHFRIADDAAHALLPAAETEGAIPDPIHFSDVTTANEQFNHWINRSRIDLYSLLAATPSGRYPNAGVPWYNTPFGRDGLITAMETLWLAPEISKDVLLYLARTQATETNADKDAEPGKIIHEARRSEMANTGEIPFKEYYGSIDATPLFVMLAGMYYDRTADDRLIREIWPQVKAALHWIHEFGDVDGDGYVEYQNKARNGLTNQGWKDSFDSVMHQDGVLALPPIAICEVQGYVYSAKRYAATLADLMNEPETAATLNAEASQLKKQFNEDFWDDEKNCFVLALDGRKKPCRVTTSNAGHSLFSGIADEDKAKQLADTLLTTDMFSGWGIRTLSCMEKRYNPISYHNGSVWPHDNALICFGLSRYGLTAHLEQVMQALFDASIFLELQRLPELYCGFNRRPGEGVTTYPVACSPQAWAVGAVFMLLQSCLRIEINAPRRVLVFDRPRLPHFLDQITLAGLRVPEGDFKIQIQRIHQDANIRILSKPPNWEVHIRK